MASAVQQSSVGTPLASVASGISDPFQRRILQNMEESEKDVRDFTQKKIDHIDNLETSKPPVLSPSPDARNYKTDPMQTFGSAAMFLATFGSLLTRQPLTTALNSASAVMNAVNKQDAVAFDKAFEKWKIDSENAWKMADYDLKAYEKALGKDEEEVKLYSVMHKNETAGYALQAKMSEQNHKDMMAQLKKGQEATNLVNKTTESDLEKWKKENPNASQNDILHAQMDFFKNNMANAKPENASAIKMTKTNQDKVNKIDTLVSQIDQAIALANAPSPVTGLPTGGFVGSTTGKIGENLAGVAGERMKVAPEARLSGLLGDIRAELPKALNLSGKTSKEERENFAKMVPASTIGTSLDRQISGLQVARERLLKEKEDISSDGSSDKGSLPPLEDRVLDQIYPINGKSYKWTSDGWEPQ